MASSSTIRRLSGLFAQYQHERDEEDEGDEVLEYMSVSDAFDNTSRSSKRKAQPVDTATPPPGHVAGARDSSPKTPPTKKRRLSLQAVTALETLIDVIADEQEPLSTRLEYCSNVWRFVREMHGRDVVAFVRDHSSSVVQVIEALLHTGYFPLQQLCFMIVAAMLHQLHKRDVDALVDFEQACHKILSDADDGMLDLLPLQETIPFSDPRVARQRVIRINRRTGLCHSFRVTRCWVSPDEKQNLARIRVNKWVDVGTTTTTFYWRDENDVVVVNVPHSCVEDVEIDRKTHVLYIWTKHIDRLQGVRLLAISSSPTDFPGLVKALVGVEIEGYDENATYASDIETKSPAEKRKTVSPPAAYKPRPSVRSQRESPTTSVDDSEVTDGSPAVEVDGGVDNKIASSVVEEPDLDAVEPDNSFAFEPEDMAAEFVNAEVDEPTSPQRTPPRRTEEPEVSKGLPVANKTKEANASNRRQADKEEEHKAEKDLQTKRVMAVSKRKVQRVEVRQQFEPENAVVDFAFTSASFLLLLVVVLPWVLFAVLHSGSDLASVRQLAQDALVVLTALLRRWSSS